MKPPSLSTITAHVRAIAKAGLLVAKEGKVNEKRLEILERESEQLKGQIKELESKLEDHTGGLHPGTLIGGRAQSYGLPHPSYNVLRKDKTDKGENDA